MQLPVMQQPVERAPARAATGVTVPPVPTPAPTPAPTPVPTPVPTLYIIERTARAIDSHVRERAGEGEEAMGLLVGDWARDPGGAPFSVAIDAPTGPLEGSPVSARFTPGGLAEVARSLAGIRYDYVVVGWYHSHPGMGVFMSDVDLRTQRAGFPHPHQVALVVDPGPGEAAAFANGPGGPGTSRAPIVAAREWDPPRMVRDGEW
jgi:proteasome lid subunit RPN8/RPN11